MALYTYELRVAVNSGGQFSEMVFHYVIDLPTPPDDFEAATQLVDAMDDGGAAAWIQRLRNCMSTEAFVSSVRARQILPTGGNTRVVVFEPTDLPGAVATPVSALQVAGCIIFVNSVDPDRTGRCFVPGVPTSRTSNSRWTATAVTTYELFGNRVAGGLVAALGTFNAVTLDRLTGNGLLIDGCYLSPKIGKQRRREVPV